MRCGLVQWVPWEDCEATSNARGIPKFVSLTSQDCIGSCGWELTIGADGCPGCTDGETWTVRFELHGELSDHKWEPYEAPLELLNLTRTFEPLVTAFRECRGEPTVACASVAGLTEADLPAPPDIVKQPGKTATFRIDGDIPTISVRNLSTQRGRQDTDGPGSLDPILFQ